MDQPAQPPKPPVQPAPQEPAITPGHSPSSIQPAITPGNSQPSSVEPTMDQPPVQVQPSWEYSLRKYLLLLATLVVSVTYAAGFNPPGGIWQAAQDGQPAGDPIIRDTHYHRYLAFFYCNATAFAASLVVIMLILILAVRHDKEKGKKDAVQVVKPLRVVMVLDLLSLVGAYAAGTCRDKISTIYSTVLVASVFVYIVVLKLIDCWRRDKNSGGPKPKTEEQLCKVLMLLATFAVSVTYAAGLSMPGGFWDSNGTRYRPGDAILKDHHSLRLTVFLLCNTTAFVVSLLITMLLIIDGKKPHEKTARSRVLYGCIFVALVSLVGAYTAGSCRKIDTTAKVAGLVGAVLAMAYILLYGCFYTSASKSLSFSCFSPARGIDDSVSTSELLDKAHSLVLLLATLAATITYTAGLNPPGGVWQDNGNGHMAGDPILLATDARRYRAFYYCNSVAFVASLVAIVLVQMEKLIKHHVLEEAMILDLFGLIGAYAAGSCRDVNTSIYVMALAGAVLVYVVIHVVFFTLDHRVQNNDGQEDQPLEKKRKRLLLFAILTATITYQAGLTPPGGFLLQDDKLGHHAGDPVLLYNYPRRYHAFFYCNSVSFMLSIALIILLVNPNLYRPAIRSNALSVCTAVGLFCLMGAYAAGSTQHIKTSIYIFVLVAVVLCVAAGVLLVFLLKRNSSVARVTPPGEQNEEERKKHMRRKYLMLLGILVASVAYQAGLEPPGGAWQSSGNGYEAGNPVMHDNRRPRYLAFFYSNSISFVASIVVIIMLLPHWLPNKKTEGEWEEWSLRVMNWTIRLDLFALLVAYAAGSNRGWKTSVIVVALIIAVLSYFVIHMLLSTWSEHLHAAEGNGNPPVEHNSLSVSSVV